MASATCLLHITDLHLLAEPGSRLHGWDVSATFDRVLAEALVTHPEADAVVLGGDLVDDESTTGYRWLDRRLHTLARPVLAVAGNHDDPAAMAEQLTCAAVHDVIEVGGWRLIGLDSHVPGSDAGRIGPRALAGLDRTLQADPAPALICVHHPPLDVGSAWIDAIGLVDRDALRATLARHPRVRGVVCGHVHQAGEYRLDGYPVWTTPSTMRQFRPGSPTFAEDSARPPGYRCLRLGADGEITTTVHRVPATRT